MANNNVPNVQQTTSKFLNNQPVFCPWASKAPLPSIAGSRCSNITTNVPNNPLVLTNRGQKNHLSKMCCQQVNIVTLNFISTQMTVLGTTDTKRHRNAAFVYTVFSFFKVDAIISRCSPSYFTFCHVFM